MHKSTHSESESLLVLQKAVQRPHFASDQHAKLACFVPLGGIVFLVQILFFTHAQVNTQRQSACIAVKPYKGHISTHSESESLLVLP